ncbi:MULTISPECIES: histone-like nucleoid-structuring protein Lsr2 [unclassified Streptomyces]|uniref:histone-like nucleoid-structuring protein Lsr2 n=1 Tax=unclassified Streptomyces TaxID=2593676 RepID=UPI001F623AFC|nr:Lsr2 family protein [Streptomyces sp. AN091965]MCI3927976.1 Lsr2 family protein [Streptomyces sp. AN091965]
MAQRVEIKLIDDLDGKTADETVTFGLDGKAYEIDLSTKNADKLRGLLEPYLKGGRKTGGSRSVKQPAAKGKSAAGQDTAKMRAWAKENGFEVNDRGRVPANIREAYEKAAA